MNVHTIECYGPPWQNFLRRDQDGLIVNDRDDCRAANARLAARHDGRLMHLVRLGDVEGVRLRLFHLGVYSTSREAAELIEGAR